MYRLLLGGVWQKVEDAVAVLPRLLHCGDPTVLLFGARAVWHLAGVPQLREPLGEVGAVATLMASVRR